MLDLIELRHILLKTQIFFEQVRINLLYIPGNCKVIMVFAWLYLLFTL